MKAYEDYIFGRCFYIYNNGHQNQFQIAASTVPTMVCIKLCSFWITGTDNWALCHVCRMYESHKTNVVNTEIAGVALLIGEAIEEVLRIFH